MKNKIFAGVFVAVLLLSALSIVYVPTGNAESQSPQSIDLGDEKPFPIDGTPGLEGKMVSWAQPDIGNTWTVIVSDDYLGGFYYQDFECVLQGVSCNIWVGLNDTVWSGYTEGDGYPAGSRLEPFLSHSRR